MLMTASPASETARGPAPPRSGALRPSVLALMPVGMAVAHRSSPVFLVRRRAASRSRPSSRGRARDTRPAHRRGPRSRRSASPCLLFFVWMRRLPSAGAPSRACRSGARRVLAAGRCAFLLALILPGRVPPCGLLALRRRARRRLRPDPGRTAHRPRLAPRARAARRQLHLQPAGPDILVVLAPARRLPRPHGAARAAACGGGLAASSVVHGRAFGERRGGTRRRRRGGRLPPRPCAAPRPTVGRASLRRGARARAVARRARRPPDPGRRPCGARGQPFSRDRIDIWRSFGAAIRERADPRRRLRRQPARWRETPVAAPVPRRPPDAARRRPPAQRRGSDLGRARRSSGRSSPAPSSALASARCRTCRRGSSLPRRRAVRRRRRGVARRSRRLAGMVGGGDRRRHRLVLRARPAGGDPMSDFDVDLFVIGGGSGGVRAARIAAGYGARVMRRRGIPGRRHLRHPRLRAEEADGLCEPLRRRVRRGRRLRLDGAEARFDWPTLIAQQGQGDRPARGRLPGQSREGRRRDRRQPRGDRGPAHGPILRTDERIRARFILVAVGAHPTLEPRDPRRRTRHHVERGLPPRDASPSGSSSSAAATSPSSSPGSSPGSAAR